MLIKFSVQNYRGFKNKLEWDLTKKSNYEFNSFAIKNDIIRNGIIFGKNGCGKSNLGLALMDITNHLGDGMMRPIQGYTPEYIYAGKSAETVKFKYVFRFGNDELVYSYQKGNIAQFMGVIFAEKLYFNNRLIFDFVLNEKCEFSSEFSVNQSESNNLIENSNHISILNYILTHFPLGVDHYISKIKKFVNNMLWFRSVEGVPEYRGAMNNLEPLEYFIIKNNLEEEFSKFLFDVSEQRYNFVKINMNQKMLMCEIDGKNIPFIFIESTGTKSLTILFYWLKHIQNASFVFVDEFDAFYHFELSWMICKKLFGLDCQLFLTTHNTLLLSNDLLRPDCNFLLDKNTIKPICDCTEKELRQGHSIEKLYRGGAFSV